MRLLVSQLLLLLFGDYNQIAVDKAPLAPGCRAAPRLYWFCCHHCCPPSFLAIKVAHIIHILLVVLVIAFTTPWANVWLVMQGVHNLQSVVLTMWICFGVIHQSFWSKCSSESSRSQGPQLLNYSGLEPLKGLHGWVLSHSCYILNFELSYPKNFTLYE